MWLWLPKRRRRELDEVNRRAETAELHAELAERAPAAAAVQRQYVEKLTERSHRIAEGLQREIDKNGWTELLQHAWGGR